MLKFVIYEDNPNALERVVSNIHKAMAPFNFEYKQEKYLSYCDELENTIKSTNDQKIYILDIEVPKVSGLEVASKIRENDWKSIIIFVTSHPECKNDIFYSRLLAFDYISKFTTYDKRLQQSIGKAIDILNKSRVLNYTYNYVSYRINFDDILYIEKVSYNNKCIIHTEAGSRLQIPGSIKEVLSLFDGAFCQSHKSCIVNLDKVKSVDTANGIIGLKNGMQLKMLANNTKKKFIESLRNLH